MTIDINNLIKLAQTALISNQTQPFSIYSCKQKQSLRHVPIFNPLIVFVLSGKKVLGGEMQSSCNEGQFLFLSENPEVTFSNIPGKHGYLALFIEFQYEDFEGIQLTSKNAQRFLIGDMNAALVQSISQLIELSDTSPEVIWNIRRKELIHLLCFYGYHDIISMISKPRINHQLIDVFKKDPSTRWDIKRMSKKLAMSESTLRRKLKLEGTGFRDLNTQVRLAHGMHLIQTTDDSISVISEKCGYQSQSRFTEGFKNRFGTTPGKLRKTLQDTDE
ncbi:Transcriptional regulator, AraC family [hydrothermal vent metagenome]|uniref:Transcriptional regulator, AraC family n=1 Tax=hydrothermal vent metagenome TaxID=652676 RepID=A0A3B0XPY5_9ZZZZ